MRHAALDLEVAAEPLVVAPLEPGTEAGEVDPGVGEADAGARRAVQLDAAGVPQEHRGGVGRRAVGGGPALPVCDPGRDLLLDQGGEPVEPAGELAGGADLHPQPVLAGVIAGVGLERPQRRPGELVVDPLRLGGIGRAPHAHVPGALRVKVVGERPADRGLGVVGDGDDLARGRCVRPDLPAADLDVDADLLLAAAVVEAEQPAGDVEADAMRVRRGLAGDPAGVLERRAADRVDVAPDQRDLAARVAALGGDLREVRDRAAVDPEIGDVEVAAAEVEDLVEDLVVVVELGVFLRAEIGEDAVLAQHQRQGLVQPGPVGAAGQAVDRVGLGASDPADVGRAHREERVDDQPADDRDRGRGERGRDAGQPERRREVDRGRDHREGEQRAQEIPALGGDVDGDRLSVADRAAVPVLAGDPRPVDQDLAHVLARRALAADQLRQRGAGGHDRDPGLAPLLGERVRPPVDRHRDGLEPCRHERARGGERGQPAQR